MVRKRICYSDFESCPCREIDLNNDVVYCNFIPYFGISLFEDNKNNSKKTDLLLKKVCPEVRNEVLHHDYRAKQLQKQEKFFLDNVKSGDRVFFTAEIYDVIFLEHPSNVYGDVKYKTIDGEIREAPAFCFRIISKGNKSAEYKTKDEYKADLYEMTAREYGYRVEKKKIKEEYIIRIFGDTQEEVDQFVLNLDSGLIIDDFYDI
ncbi:MAG: hypothetical protein JSV62_07795 [Promethearchaeota archaeon]|nr:MAG: hypothetical protein JSV62_07795 [Candidatus Lokiarchaeota archaeon]